MDDSVEDPRLPHHRHPKELVSLNRLAGTLYLYLFIYVCVCVQVLCVYVFIL